MRSLKQLIEQYPDSLYVYVDSSRESEDDYLIPLSTIRDGECDFNTFSPFKRYYVVKKNGDIVIETEGLDIMNCIQCFTESKRQQERERDYDRRRLEAGYKRQLWGIQHIFQNVLRTSKEDGGDAFVIASFAVLALALSDEHFKERVAGFLEWSKTEQPAIQIKRDWKLEKMLRLLSEFRREHIANTSDLEEQIHLLKAELKDWDAAFQRTKSEMEEAKAMLLREQYMRLKAQLSSIERIQASRSKRYRQLLGLKMALQDVQRWQQALDLKNYAHRDEAVRRGDMPER